MPIPVQGPRNLTATFSKSHRISAAGKESVKVIVNWEADPLYINLESKEYAALIAQEIAAEIQRDIRDIPERVKPETVARRETALRAWNAGRHSKTLMAKYAGGRIGPMSPKVSDKMFQDSGRLLKSIILQPRKTSRGTSSITMNVAINRFDPKTFGGGEAGLEQFVFARLRQHVPAFKSSGMSPHNYPPLQKALDKAAGLMFARNSSELASSRLALGRAYLNLGRSLAGLAKALT